MRLVLLCILMAFCVRLGMAQPLFYGVAWFLLIWIVMRLFARGTVWLTGLTTPSPAGRGLPDMPFGRTRVCPDSRCGRVNIGQARFCAQCGRRLA
jgi:hypothetical protein